jgi:hypothetical protein
MAAERTGRKAALIELDPKYVDVIVQRWQRAGKGPVVHAQTRYGSYPADRQALQQSLKGCAEQRDW